MHTRGIVLGVAASGLAIAAALGPSPERARAGSRGTDFEAPRPECAADVVPDGVVDEQDLVAVAGSWGDCPNCPSDVTGDGLVDVEDLADIVLNWGACGPPSVALPAGGMHICATEDDAFATADGGCKDLATGLVWSRHNMGHGVNWHFEDAEQFILESTEGGFTDWRFPTVEEMETVAAHGAATHFSGFSYCHNWSTERQGQDNYATNVLSGETILLQVRGAGADYGCFVGVREAVAPSGCNGNGICEPGEDCENCGDCEGKTNGPPSGRFCCGNGELEGPEGDGTICDDNP